MPGFLLIAVGLGFSFVPISIAALAGVQPAEAGLASGLMNTTQQIGGALGIAALSAIATSTTEQRPFDGHGAGVCTDERLPAAFIAGGIVAFAGILVATLRRQLPRPRAGIPEVEPAFEQAA